MRDLRALFYTGLIIIIFQLSVSGNPNADSTLVEYKNNLDKAAELFLAETEIPENILLKLVPLNYNEFHIYYGTTSPDNKLKNTQFFYKTSKMIFRQVTIKKNEDFYLPSLQLISFADGEFAEEFIVYLKKIIELDSDKFCNSVRDKEYLKHNPMKYYFNKYNSK